MQSWLVLLALIAGAGVALQPVLNAMAAAEMGHPLWGALASGTVTLLVLAIAAAALRLPLPANRIHGFPPWLYGGGLLGALMLFAALLVVPMLGVTTTVALIIAGQLAAALTIDNFGWLGVPQHVIGVPRVLGAVCLLAGVILIRTS